MAGVEVGDEGSGGDGGLLREETGEACPCAAVQVRTGVTGVTLGVDEVVLLGLVEVLAVLGHGDGLVDVVQSQRQLGNAVLVHQQVVLETVAIDVGLDIEACKGIKLAAADGLQGVDGGGDLGSGPVVVHKELINAPDAVLVGLHPGLVVAVDGILVGNAAGGDHGIVPGDEHVGTLGVHVAHHLVEAGGDGLGAAVGLLVEEVAVEAIVIHDLDELVSNGEGAVLGLLAEAVHLLGVAVAAAPGEAQGCHDGNAVGVGGIDVLAGGAADDALIGAGPVDEGVGVLPVVKGIGEEGVGALGACLVVIGVGHGAEHQLCLGVGQGIDLDLALSAVCQRDAGPAVGRIGIGLGSPLQQGVDVEGSTDGGQGFPVLVCLIHLGGAVITGADSQARGQHTQDHDDGQQHRKKAARIEFLHIFSSFGSSRTDSWI